ncbi:MAG: cysteine desulfurase family protein [Candidatus Nanoarchaeia archaeon]
MSKGDGMKRHPGLVYLDNAKTTKVDPKVCVAMRNYHLQYYGAPSTTEYGHSFGLKIKEDVEKAKAVIAKKINAEPDEIIFTSGEIENDNLAIKGVCFAKQVIPGKKIRIITTKIERKPILDVFNFLESLGCYETIYIGVDKEGFVNIDEFELSLTNDTLLVVMHHVNHEIGTIQDIERIGKICRDKGILFYVDATQSFTKIPIDVKRMNIDLLSISSDKIHGPKGVGALYVRKGIHLHRLFEGGENSSEIRPFDTPNVPGIIGFAKAVEIAKEEDNERMRKMRDYLIEELLKISNSRLNGSKDKRVCNNVNISFRYVEGESMMMLLDQKGIVATTGSACFSSNLQPSHVILSLGFAHEDAHGSLRLTLSKFNTMSEIKYVAKSIKEVVEKLRKISPLGEK